MPKCQPAVTGCFWAFLCAVFEAQVCRISGNPEHTCAHTALRGAFHCIQFNLQM